MEYWSEVNFSDFCGLSLSHFDLNSIPPDICNADQNDTYSFDDLISIRVFNHFSNDAAREEYDVEEANAETVTGYSSLTNVGDKAIIPTEFGKLDGTIIQVVKGTFTLYLEVNGNTANGTTNCFDESSVIDFARALVLPL